MRASFERTAFFLSAALAGCSSEAASGSGGVAGSTATPTGAAATGVPGDTTGLTGGGGGNSGGATTGSAGSGVVAPTGSTTTGSVAPTLGSAGMAAVTGAAGTSAGGSTGSEVGSAGATVTGSAAGADATGGAGGATQAAGGTTASGLIDGELPVVYDAEHTGASCDDPELPAFSALESVASLPDPFVLPGGERMTTREQWQCQRHRIRRILEEYDVGLKPGKPSTFEATLDGSTLNIRVGEGGNEFTMTAPISRPAGADSGPIPAIIGINSPTGSLPADVFSSRGIATIRFNSDDLHGNGFSGTPFSSGNFYGIYPDTTAGSMIRWAWGVSRIIDALEMLPEANIDVTHLAVSGCSFQGKIALYAGAFDERIRLTIPHESGGGGTISWRYSDMLEDRDNTEVENLHHALGAAWYHPDLGRFANDPNKLPFDHHQLIGMVAPRAFLAIESTNVPRMGAEAARVDALAARKIWDALGVPTRMGAAEENVSHCSWHNGFTADLEAYVDRFLLDQDDVDTDILRSVYDIDEATWIPWDAPTLQ